MYFCVRTGVNLLIGTESGLMLLDRSGQNKGKSFLCDMCCGVAKRQLTLVHTLSEMGS